jgi:trimethyllysine dioxygenase
MAHGDLAYSNQALPAHTDTTYFTDPAGLQIFHLLSHEGEGGSSLLVDGFYAASKLDKEDFEVLRRLKVPRHASGSKGYLLQPEDSSVLRCDEDGRLLQVRWNNEDRGVIGQGWSAKDVEDWYRAARRYEEILQSKEAEYWVQLEPGTMVGESGEKDSECA